MAFAKIYSAQPLVLKGEIITVEADLQKGLHNFNIVGLPDKAVEESRDRVSAAIKNSGWKPPKQHNQKITIALAPADVRKEGSYFDVPVALAFLVATKELVFDPEGKIFVGELALDGSARPIKGVLNIALEAKRQGLHELYVPTPNAKEAALVDGLSVFPFDNLGKLVSHLQQSNEGSVRIASIGTTKISDDEGDIDDAISHIRGQQNAKRALMIAAAGGHNVALWGPPGTGKTLLAKGLRSLLPSLDLEKAIEVTSIHSLIGSTRESVITQAPFRSPHHTASYVSVIGGGTVPRPGEVTLAHHGVLFLDEFPEFDKRVLESLRQPIEEGVVHVARARRSEIFPARFLLIAAMNPCPCGYYGDAKKACTCMPSQIQKYQRKVSGPIIDRIDLWVEVPRIDHDELAPGSNHADQSKTKEMVEMVKNARSTQQNRFVNEKYKLNSQMDVRAIDAYIELSEKTSALLSDSARSLDLSPRAFHRIIKLSRTIADLDNSPNIEERHLLEALQYRPRKLFS